VLFFATGIREAKIRKLHVFFFYQLEYIGGCHVASGKRSIERDHSAGAMPSLLR
jgi:hypothetical protein